MRNVVVTGDLVIDHDLAEDPGQPSSHQEPAPSAALRSRLGGAWYLAQLIEDTCKGVGGANGAAGCTVSGPERIEIDTLAPSVLAKSRISHAYEVWSPVAKQPPKFAKTDKERKERVWRIRTFLGCRAAGVRAVPVPHPAPESATVLVIDDLGLDFAYLPAHEWPACLQRCDKAESIVLKATGKLDDTPLWRHLLEHANKLTVLVAVEQLRARGASITLSLSWDRTIEETVAEFESGLSAHDLALCRRVVVTFDLAGAASFTRWRTDCALKGGKTVCERRLDARCELERFVYRPDELPGAWKGARAGRVFGASSIAVAALVRHQLEPEGYPLFVALERALEAQRENFALGGGPFETDERTPLLTDAAHGAVVRTLAPPPRAPVAPKSAYYSSFRHDLLSDADLRGQAANESDLLRDLTGHGLEYVASKATEIVIWGPESALRGAPSARYGKYFTVDREEIERINAVRTLIEAYRGNALDTRPLSIAVFGPPGAGKSFAIKQLATLYSSQDPLEFNLSELEESRLVEAFHQVRDQSLRGEMPFVFWDEFDCEDLRWLKLFLAPMQDAQFRSGAIVHPFGKAVFVFAGGVKSKFQDFEQLAGTEKEKKAPDFVSRLRAFVNIKGPNPTGATEEDASQPPPSEEQSAARWRETAEKDPAFLIRRAIMLRTNLERYYPRLIDEATGMASVSAAVVHAFLGVRLFRHGSRSLEQLVKMSDVRRSHYFAASALPPRDLLEMHATTDFLGLVEAGEIEAPVIEALARACHEAWCAEKKKPPYGYIHGETRNDDPAKGPLTHPMLVPYGDLPEAGKEANRGPARLVRAKLAAVGLRIRRVEAGSPPPSLGRVRDDLMRIEHDVWLRDKLLNGYEWSAATSDHLRLHRDAAHFDALDAQERGLDAAIVDSIPEALKSKGYTLEQVAPPASPPPAARKA